MYYVGMVDFGAKMLTRINLSPKISAALEDWWQKVENPFSSPLQPYFNIAVIFSLEN